MKPLDRADVSSTHAQLEPGAREHDQCVSVDLDPRLCSATVLHLSEGRALAVVFHTGNIIDLYAHEPYVRGFSL